MVKRYTAGIGCALLSAGVLLVLAAAASSNAEAQANDPLALFPR